MTANNSLFLYLDQVMKSNMARFCSSHSSSPEGVPKDAPETAEVTRKRYLQMIYRSESIAVMASAGATPSPTLLRKCRSCDARRTQRACGP